MIGVVAIERSSPALLGCPRAFLRKRQDVCTMLHPFLHCATSVLGKASTALMGKQVCSPSWCSILPVTLRIG
jgi:hypothetical protein